MLGRLFEKFIVLLIVLALLSAATQTVLSALRAASVHSAGLVPGMLKSMLTVAFAGTFGIGLLVRLRRWSRYRDPQRARLEVTQLRRARLAPRRPAEDVPVHGPVEELPEDPDPALGADEE